MIDRPWTGLPERHLVNTGGGVRSTAPPSRAGDEQHPSGELTRFAIQEHHARRLHWDLRLEHDGVLASWALPRGIPTDPGENRLAVRTEDHPLSYLEFEGEIPAGEYGAGSISIWDSGTCTLEKFTDTKVIVSFRGGAGERSLCPLSHRREPLDDPPHGSPRRPGAGADAREARADGGDAVGPSRARRAVRLRDQVGRGAGDLLPPGGAAAAAEPEPSRHHRPVPGGRVTRPPARRPGGDPRRRAGRIRRARGARLSAPTAEDAPRVGDRHSPACGRGPGHLRDLRPAVPGWALRARAPLRAPSRDAGVAAARRRELADPRLPSRRRRRSARRHAASAAWKEWWRSGSKAATSPADAAAIG